MNTTTRKPVRVIYERTTFGGWEYALMDGDTTVASGWSAGSKRDAREEAAEHARGLGVEVAR